MPYYRIVRDGYCGYEVQSWRWWWPIWMECSNPERGQISNSHSSVEKAEEFAKRKAGGKIVPVDCVVKQLGKLKD